MASISLRVYNREIEGLIDQGQIEEAIAHCKHILESVPKHIATYRLLGKALLEIQHYTDASDIFQRVLSCVPDDFVSHVGMSIIRENERNLDSAIWHMERAFEVQPANPAIQQELRRLYGRRDGMEPPKIRLTRAALARMYAKGNLYQQAIGELRAALSEDPQRPDMQVLLAQMYYHAGQFADAADVCGNLLKRLPFCLEANRILAVILPETDRAADTQVYRQRVISLDPYFAKAPVGVLSTDGVPDHAVSVEKLEFRPGEAAAKESEQPSWATTLGVAFEEQKKETLPDWLTPLEEAGAKTSAEVVAPFTEGSTEEFVAEETGEVEAPGLLGEVGTTSVEPAAEEQIPDFLKQAGWAPSKGPVEEAPTEFEPEITEAEGEGIAPAEIPDWLRQMAPSESLEQAPPVEEEGLEEIPPWLEEAQPGPTDSVVEWLKEKEGEAETPAEEQELPEWLKPAEQEPSGVTADLPEWLVQEGAAAEEELPEWLQETAEQKVIPAAEEATMEVPTAEPTEETAPWPVTPVEEEPETVIQVPSLEQPAAEATPEIAIEEGAPAEMVYEQTVIQPPSAPVEEVPELLGQVEEEMAVEEAAPIAEQPVVEEIAPLAEQPAPVETAAVPEFDLEDQESALAWLESLALKQGAVEEQLTTRPEERPETPEWLTKQAEEAEMRGELPTYQPTETVEGLVPTEAEVPAEVIPPAVFPTEEVPEVPEVTKEGEGIPEWMMEPVEAEQPAVPVEEAPEWLKEFQPEVPEPEAALPAEPTAEVAAEAEGLPEWMLQPEEAEASAQPAEEIPEWLKELKTGEVAVEPAAEVVAPEEVPAETLPDWLRQIEAAMPVEELGDTQPAGVKEGLAAETAEVPAVEPGLSAQDQEAALAWLESLAEKQGAPEEQLITTAAERQEAPPEWVKKATGELQPPEAEVPTEVVAEVEAPEAALPEAEIPVEAVLEEVPLETVEAAVAEVPEEEVTEEVPLEAVEAVIEEAALPEEEEIPGWLKEEITEEEFIEPAERAGVTTWREEEAEELPAWIMQAAEEEPTEPTAWPPAEVEEVLPEEKVPVAKIDLNTASLSQLEALPGIGFILAQNILVYRETSGPFKGLEDLQNVAGFDMALLDQISDLVEVKAVPAIEEAVERVPEPVDEREKALAGARSELFQGNIPVGIQQVSSLIKQGVFLKEIIKDLQEALYRSPSDISLWETLGDAYLRDDQFQDALDAYIRAEDLL